MRSALLVIGLGFSTLAATAQGQSVTPHHDCEAGDWDKLDDTLAKASHVVLARSLAKPNAKRVAPRSQELEVLSTLSGKAPPRLKIEAPDKCGHLPRAGALVIVITDKDGGYLLRSWASEAFWKKVVKPVAADRAAVEASVARIVNERWPTWRRLRVQYAPLAGKSMKTEKARVKFVKRQSRGLAVCTANRYGNVNFIQGNVRTDEDRVGFAQFVEVQLITDSGIERLVSGRKSKVPRRSSPRCP